jgi:hypothetical protein
VVVVVVLPVAELLVLAWLATLDPSIKDRTLVGDDLAAILAFGYPLTWGHHPIELEVDRS